ncbi:MAG: hypothetical protein ABI232_09005 [Jatrophihabitantaceae bacterium]
MSDQHVVADVQVHNLHPLSPEPDASTDDVQTPVVVLDPGRANNY